MRCSRGVPSTSRAFSAFPPTAARARAVLLLVADDPRNAQIVAQLRKLEDVMDVHPDPDARASFDAVARYVQPAGGPR